MRKTIDVTQAPTPEQIAMLTEAAKLPIPDDDEYPEFTEAELARLSPQALKKARSLGKGYTSVLSRILENALNDPNTIKHYL